jgi:glycosidase
VLAANPDAIIIGELWKKADVLPLIHGDQVDTAMNYRFRNAVMGYFGKVDDKGFPDDNQALQNPSLFARKLNAVREDYPDATYYTLMNLLDSHDTQRILWSLTPGDRNREAKEFNAANLALGKDMLALAAVVQMTTPGAPTVYYGDELGMTGGHDPGSRGGMPWDRAKWDRDLFEFVKQIIRLRKAQPVLRRGQYRALMAEGESFAYERVYEGQRIVVAFNTATHPADITIPLETQASAARILFGDSASAALQSSSLKITAPARSGVVVALEN